MEYIKKIEQKYRVVVFAVVAMALWIAVGIKYEPTKAKDKEEEKSQLTLEVQSQEFNIHNNVLYSKNDLELSLTLINGRVENYVTQLKKKGYKVRKVGKNIRIKLSKEGSYMPNDFLYQTEERRNVVPVVKEKIKELVIDKTLPEIKEIFNGKGITYAKEKEIFFNAANGRPYLEFKINDKNISSGEFYINGEKIKEIPGKNGSYRYDFPEERVSSYELEVKDLAGNVRKVSKTDLNWCFDYTGPRAIFKPEKELTVSNINGIKTFFSRDMVSFSLLKQKDEGSGIKAVSYFVSQKEVKNLSLLTRFEANQSELKALGVKSCDKAKVQQNTIKYVYAVLMDKAENFVVIPGGRVLVDTVEPQISLETENDAEKLNNEEITNKDIEFKYECSDDFVLEEKTNDFGELKTIANTSYVVYSFEEDEWKQQERKTILRKGIIQLSSKKYRNKRVKIMLRCEDMAGNVAKKYYEVVFDLNNPVITFDFEDEYQYKGKYCYNTSKNARVIISDTNLDAKSVRLKGISKKMYSIESQKKNEIIYKVSFTKEGEFDFYVTCKDYAGNKVESIKQKVLLDKTKPEIEIEYFRHNKNKKNEIVKDYEEGKLHIFDNSLDEEALPRQITNLKGKRIPISYKRKSKNEIVGFFRIDKEVKVKPKITIKDNCGNQVVWKDKNEFLIDKRNPVIEVKGIEDHSETNKEVTIVVNVSDENIDKDACKISLKREGNSQRIEEDYHESSDNFVRKKFFKLNDDDEYLLCIKAKDKAGHKMMQKKNFLINQKGSTFSVYEKENDWNKKAISQEKNIQILEINRSEVQQKYTHIYLYHNNQKKELDKKDYIRKKIDSKNGFYQYLYQIEKSNFQEEGSYSLGVEAIDSLRNNTISLYDDESERFEFVVDKTPPNIQLKTKDLTYDQKKQEYYAEVEVRDVFGVKDVEVLQRKDDKRAKSCEVKKEKNTYRFYSKQKDSSCCFEIKARDYAENNSMIKVFLGRNKEEFHKKNMNHNNFQNKNKSEIEKKTGVFSVLGYFCWGNLVLVIATTIAVFMVIIVIIFLYLYRNK